MGLIIDIDETASGERGWLDNSKDRVRRYKKKVASEVQDLYLAYQDEFDRGPLNPERRAACEFDPLLFGKTYFKEDFYLPFSEQHKIEAHKLQQAVIKKAWFANADRRGGGRRGPAAPTEQHRPGGCPAGEGGGGPPGGALGSARQRGGHTRARVAYGDDAGRYAPIGDRGLRSWP